MGIFTYIGDKCENYGASEHWNVFEITFKRNYSGTTEYMNNPPPSIQRSCYGPANQAFLKVRQGFDNVDQAFLKARQAFDNVDEDFNGAS